MKTRYKIGVGFILLIIISAGLLSIWWQDQKQKMYDRSLRSSYDYDVMLTTDSTLSNMTLYLPLPVINNTSSVGMDIVEHHFNNNDPSWEYALVDTEHGLMLSLKNVSISIYLNARNEWWIGGWQSNSYWEVMEVKLFGSQNGWTTVNGELVTGEGTYEI